MEGNLVILLLVKECCKIEQFMNNRVSLTSYTSVHFICLMYKGRNIHNYISFKYTEQNRTFFCFVCLCFSNSNIQIYLPPHVSLQDFEYVIEWLIPYPCCTN